MIFSHRWLQEYVPDLPSPDVLLEKLTLHSVEVEGVQDAATALEGIVVGRILSVSPHPNADRLRICIVDDGVEHLAIVCGGSNVAPEMLVACARVGARVRWHGEGDLITLKPAVIRGEKSSGMICSANEIGMAQQFPPSDEKEILDLTDVLTEVAPGTPLAMALQMNDAQIDIDNKSMTHRSDLFSHIGMAREIAAVFDLPSITTQPLQPLPALPSLSTSVQTDTSARYMLAELRVQVGPTPAVIAERLQECGISVINNIVDITNYVMLEYGQPLHAFDADTLTGDIVVRSAQAGEEIMTLDKENKKLDDQCIVIADQKQPIAVAGVIGGFETRVTETTQRILLEAAHFDALSVRRTAQKIQTRTESALRFEKGIPPQRVEQGFLRAIELLQEHASAELISASDLYPGKEQNEKQAEPIVLHEQFLERLSGVDWTPEEVSALLERLDCEVTTMQEGERRVYSVTPPWFRTDMAIPEDVVEEIVRLRGTESIEEKKLYGQLDVPPLDPELSIIQKIRRQMQLMGGVEVYNYSFYGLDLMQRCGMDPAIEHLEIDNPLSEDQRYLRTSLLPRMLENVALNQYHSKEFTLFEIGHLYFADREVRQFAAIVFGTDAFRRLRGMTDVLLRNLGVDATTEVIAKTTESCPYWQLYAGGRALRVRAHDQDVGSLGMVSAETQKAYDITGDSAFAVFSIPVLVQSANASKRIIIPSEYPSITLDWSIIVDSDRAWHDIEEVITQEAGALLQSIDIFDIYEGDQIPVGKKSIGLTVVLQSATETLQMKNIEQWRDRLIQKLKEKYGVTLRGR